MAGQFDLGSKHQKYKSNFQEIIGSIFGKQTTEIVKELISKKLGVAPCFSDQYDDYLGLTLFIEEMAISNANASSILVDQALACELLKENYDSSYIYGVICQESGPSVQCMFSTTIEQNGNSVIINGKKLIAPEQQKADKFLVLGKDVDCLPCAVLIDNQNISIENNKKTISGSEFSINIINFDNQTFANTKIFSVQSIMSKTTAIVKTLTAAVAAGIGHSAIITALETTKKVKDSTGQAITNSQSAQFTLADMFQEVEAGRMLTYFSASLVDSNKPSSKYSSMAKVQATDSAGKVAIDAMHLLGNLGYISSEGFAAMIQQAVNTQIKAGTNRVQRNSIYQEMLAGN